MKEAGIDPPPPPHLGHELKSIAQSVKESFSYVIAIFDTAKERIRYFPLRSDFYIGVSPTRVSRSTLASAPAAKVTEQLGGSRQILTAMQVGDLGLIPGIVGRRLVSGPGCSRRSSFHGKTRF